MTPPAERTYGNNCMQFRNVFSLLLLLATGMILTGFLAGPVMATESSGSWQVTTVDDDIRYYPFISAAYDRDNVPHIAYRENVTRSIRHAWQSGGTWTTKKVGPSAGTFSTSIGFGPDGNPVVTYGDGLYFGNLMVAQKSGDSWTSSVVARGSMGDAGQFSSVAFDRQGVPHIAYNDGQVLASLYYASLNTTTGEWEFSLIDDDGAYTGDAGYSPSLKIDAAGHPHVAYISDDPWGLRYATSSDGANWTVTKLDELDRLNYFSRTYTGVSLALDSRGYPHISYYNQTASETTPSLIYYLSWSGTGWDRETVAVLSKRDFTTSLMIDSRDVPHIAYCDVAGKALIYATRSPSGDWSTQTVVQGPDLIRMPFLALDSSGRAGIAYYDMTSHALKFAQG
ncbi:MAG: hypothetical protein Q8R70_00370 [Methanoregula sp.]|nr:hypothetical protein [Methanoregula sp.]